MRVVGLNWFQNRWPKLVSKSIPGGVPGGSREGPGRVPEGTLSQVGSQSPVGTLLGALSGPSGVPLGPLLDKLGPPRNPLGTVLGPSWLVLRTSWGTFGPSWKHLGPHWSLHCAFTSDCKNHTKTIVFPTILASGSLSGGALGVSWAVLEAVRAISEPSSAI